jgi:hypothetical protein
MADLQELKRRRSQAVAEFKAWRRKTAKTKKPGSASLTDAEINRMVHELR